MTTYRIRYSGQGRAGEGRGGATVVGDVAAWIERKYRSGWRTLTVHSDSEQVGGIASDSTTGRRVWWGTTN